MFSFLTKRFLTIIRVITRRNSTITASISLGSPRKHKNKSKPPKAISSCVGFPQFLPGRQIMASEHIIKEKRTNIAENFSVEIKLGKNGVGKLCLTARKIRK